MTVGGKPEQVTRREAVRFKLFEAAMKGDVRAIIYLEKEAKELDEQRGQLQLRLMDLIRRYYSPDSKEKPTDEVAAEMAALQGRCSWTRTT